MSQIQKVHPACLFLRTSRSCARSLKATKPAEPEESGPLTLNKYHQLGRGKVHAVWVSSVGAQVVFD